jgi:hypothetical protein
MLCWPLIPHDSTNCGQQDRAAAMHTGASGAPPGQGLCDKGPAGHITSPELFRLLEDLLSGHLVPLRSRYVSFLLHALESGVVKLSHVVLCSQFVAWGIESMCF